MMHRRAKSTGCSQQYIYTIDVYQPERDDWIRSEVFDKAKPWKNRARKLAESGLRVRACRWRRDDLRNVQPKRRTKKWNRPKFLQS